MFKFFLTYCTLLFLFGGNLFAQQTLFPLLKIKDSRKQIVFRQSDYQQFGLDVYQHQEWKSNYDTLSENHLSGYKIAYKSVAENIPDDVDALLKNIRNFSKDSLSFTISGSARKIRFIQKNDTVLTLFLPKMKADYSIEANYKGLKIGQLNVKVYSLITQKIVIVPLTNTALNKDSLREKINAIYSQANIKLSISFASKFKSQDFDEQTLFDNPSPTNDRYTNQMRAFRDLYFEKHPNADKKAYYVFIIPGFVDPKIKGYMARNKAMAFVKENSEEKLAISISRELGFGIGMLEDSWRNDGPAIGTTNNLMDRTSGVHLTKDQWEKLRHSSNSYSFYDNDEDVRTNNGMVAYYFWKEDKNGFIILENGNPLKSITRPFKKNYRSYHLDIREFLYMTVFKIGSYLISWWHILVFVFIFTTAYFLRRTFHYFLTRKFRRVRFLKISSRIILFLSACLLYYWCFLLINSGYERFEVKAGKLKDFQFQTVKQASKSILVNENLRHRTEKELCSELLIKKGSNWYVKKKKKVLYFDLKKDKSGEYTRFRFRKSSDSLNLKSYNISELAQSHYMVFNYLDPNGKVINQRVINHLGVEITPKLTIEDPAKRILVFVNGYRPTSIGHSFEENFKDIQLKGFEFPNTNNLIYNFDRYNYWRPWNEIDLLFQKRINPSETFYADGHFSVSTSNHRSLVNFTSVSAVYPKRCKNLKNHVCYKTTIKGGWLFGSREVKTTDLHRTRPNKTGFREREKNGRIAGRNLLQIFNELPNRSDNDTIFIVAHSMGYAYTLGMLKELRGKINFGGFYIIAPENASSGNVNLREWDEVWQYGSNFNKGKSDAPCLLDGVAPQTKAGGLTNKQRVYIPKRLDAQKGFYDSHFVGYYTWIFNIPEGKKGYIKQR